MKVRSPGLSVESAVDCVTVIATVPLPSLLRGCSALMAANRRRALGDLFTQWNRVYALIPSTVYVSLYGCEIRLGDLMLATFQENNGSEYRRAVNKHGQVHGHRS